MNIFDILGPVMVGPSSSHTAGAVRIGLVTRRLLGEKVKNARIGMYGSFAATGKGHGTDRALVAGLLGMEPDDTRIPDSFSQAQREDMKFEIGEVSLSGAHPNTAVLKVEGVSGRTLEVQASSLGGGRPTLIVHNIDQPGHVAKVTSMLFESNINIANMSLYRDRRGGIAVMVIEADKEIPEKMLEWLKQQEGIKKVTYINAAEGEENNGI